MVQNLTVENDGINLYYYGNKLHLRYSTNLYHMKKQKKQINIIENNSTIITKDGEILKTDRIKKQLVSKEPSFYKVYTDAIYDISALFGLSPMETRVFTSLAKNMSYNNMIVLIKSVKEVLMLDTGITSMNTINKSIQQLKNKGLIIPFAKSSYIINPDYVGKGRWEDIEALKIQIEYKKKGKEIKLIKVTKSLIEYSIEDLNPKYVEAEEVKSQSLEDKRQLNIFNDE